MCCIPSSFQISPNSRRQVIRLVWILDRWRRSCVRIPGSASSVRRARYAAKRAMTYVLTPLSSFSSLLINVRRRVSYSVTFAIEVSPFVGRTRPNSPNSRLAYGLSAAAVRRGPDREMALPYVPTTASPGVFPTSTPDCTSSRIPPRHSQFRRSRIALKLSTLPRFICCFNFILPRATDASRK